MVGKQFLHYEILEKLGEGGASVVYRAVDRRLNRLVAIKFLSPRVAGSKEQRARLEREARTISALNHPSIATLFDIGTYEKQQFLVLEYLPGGTLRNQVKRLTKAGQFLPFSTILEYGGQIAAGLEYAHKRGIIHRDIKTDNIMLAEDGAVKITDFGVAKLQGISHLTKEGEPVGTLAYMPPEQFKGEEVDERADIYSFGVVLYELLTGQLPFRGNNEATMLYSILNEVPQPVSAARPETPEALVEIVCQMLNKETGSRPRSMDELQQRMQAPHVRQKLSLTLGEHLLGKTASVAVMPFACLSTEKENEYFAEGITEDLIHALAQIPSLHVPARTSSFALRDEKDLRSVGYKLNVQHIVEGSFRRFESKVRLTARLVNVHTGFEEWSASFDRDMRDIFALQVEIARTIAEALQVELAREPGAALALARMTNIEAYELCLKGRYYWARRPVGIANAIQYFKQALELDPNYTPALTGLADCYNTLGAWENGSEPPRTVMPLGLSHADKALKLEEHSAEAHTSRAYCLFHFHRDWFTAEHEFRRAIELNPNYPAAHHWFSHFLTARGRTEESLVESKRALELDPLDMMMNVHLAWHYQLAGQFDEALKQSLRSVRMEPGWHWSHFFLGWAYEQKSKMSEAIEALSKSVEFSGGHTVMMGALGHAYGRAGDVAKAREILHHLTTIAKSKYVASYEIGLIHFALGNLDEGFHWLEKATEERSGWLVYLTREPRLKFLHSDSRFQDLIERVSLK